VQDTYMMIKPEAVQAGQVGRILAMAETNGFKLLKIKSFTMERALAEKFYAVHRERPFFADLVQYICSGPVVGVHCQREEAVSRMRELVGATNPEEAACGTIRFLFGTDLSHNAVHASDSPLNAKLELGLIFGGSL